MSLPGYPQTLQTQHVRGHTPLLTSQVASVAILLLVPAPTPRQTSHRMLGVLPQVCRHRLPPDHLHCHHPSPGAQSFCPVSLPSAICLTPHPPHPPGTETKSCGPTPHEQPSTPCQRNTNSISICSPKSSQGRLSSSQALTTQPVAVIPATSRSPVPRSLPLPKVTSSTPPAHPPPQPVPLLHAPKAGLELPYPRGRPVL